MKCFSESIKIVCVCVVMQCKAVCMPVEARGKASGLLSTLFPKQELSVVQSAPIRLGWVATWLANLMDPPAFAFQCYDYKFTLPPGNGGARL